MTNFKKFDKAFRVTARPAPTKIEEDVVGEIDWLFATYGGFEFEDGLYRLHSQADAEKWRILIGNAFPEESAHVTPFGQDWQGNQFGWRGGHNPAVLLFQIGSGEAYEIADSLQVAHDEEFVDHAQEALNLARWREWSAAGGGKPSAHQCVGYRIPLFLGGQEQFDNLELSDLDVYWEITAQLLNKIRGRPPGTRISGVNLVGALENEI